MSTRVLAAAALAAAVFVPRAAAAQEGRDLGRFRHEVHGSYECSECHSNGHATTSSDRSWCADCHHVNVAYEQCTRCHSADEISPEPLRRLATFHLPGADRTRSLMFDHRLHRDLSCAKCHTGGAALRVEAGCASCHESHHTAENTCVACHAEPPAVAHTESVHQNLSGCGAAGCHTTREINYVSMLGERSFCLACHVDQRDHEAPNPCVECHKVGQPTPPERSP